MHIQAGTNSNRSQHCDIHNDIWGNTLLLLLAEGTNESWLHPLLLWNRARDCSMQRTADLRWFCCYLINKIHYQQRQKRGTSNNLHFSFGLCLLSPYSQTFTAQCLLRSRNCSPGTLIPTTPTTAKTRPKWFHLDTWSLRDESLQLRSWATF